MTRLGAEHVVRTQELVPGARVVVRHRLGDASATDALGELVAADATTLVVATRRGEVRIARADVLAAKAVPPPPVRRGAPHTAIGVDALERVMAEHWRAAESVALGEWRLRASGGFTSRANSALALGSPGADLDAALAEVTRFYGERGLPAVVAAPHAGPAADDPLVAALTARGWSVRTPAVVMTAAVRDLATTTDLPAGLSLTTAAAPDEAWSSGYHYRGETEVPAAGRRLLVSADEQVFVTITDGGRPVAVARGSVSPGWVGVTAVEVALQQRRRGLARRMLAEVAAWGGERGARSAWLQVAADNSAARALYEGEGFGTHHAYEYRVAPAG